MKTVRELAAAPGEPGQFDLDTGVRLLDDSSFAVELVPRWNSLGPLGGYLATILLRGMMAAAPHSDYTPRSLSVHFVRPSTASRADVHVQVLHQGQTVRTVAAQLVQGDKLRASALGVFVAPTSGPDYSGSPPPLLSSPASLSAIAFDPATMPPYAACWDYRHAEGSLNGGDSEARMAGWLKLKEPRRPDVFILPVIADALPRALGAVVGTRNLIWPTLDLTIHFPNPVPRELGSDDYFAVLLEARATGGGVGVEDGWIWTSGGLLVAISRQLGVTLITH